MPPKKESFQPPCGACGSRCCGYVAIGINSPRSVQGRENIRWFLLHENVAVYIDHDKEWYAEFKTPCRALNKKGRCTIYERRPKVCGDYGNEHGVCEYFDTPYVEKFVTLEQFEKWQEARTKKTAKKV
ncbi:MAG: YkgJ family cysteine cluster protein [Spirochaetota bacterium]|jgi:Fe-S-cluster containining protein|nr:YkgJ family cysteine cluster protein [Spirochaetota bacterium]